jgi:hypothetical protein
MNKQYMVDMFAAADTLNAENTLRFMTEDVAFRFGNAPTLHGHVQVAEALTTLYQTVKKMRHTIVGVHNCGDVWAVETVANYVDRYGRSFSFPACNIMVLRGARMSEYKIFVDNSEMFRPPGAS